MGNIYYYCYYQIFKKVKSLLPNSKLPEYTSVLIISFCEICNFLTALFLFENRRQIKNMSLDIFTLVMIAIVALNYLLLVYNGKSEKIVEYYQDRERNVLLEMLVGGYMLSSIVVCLYFSTPVK